MTPTTSKTSHSKVNDTVISEVRRVKTELLERCHYDLAVMAREARARQAKSGHRVVKKKTEG